MNELVLIKGDDVFTNSLVIANGTELAHHSITRKIRDYEKDFLELGKVGYHDQPLDSGQKQKIYLLNEMQATYLITLLENNEVVRAFKLALVKDFFRMRRILLQKQTSDWQQTRLHGKQVRLQETDAIKALIEYATAQGSANAGKLYMVYTKLVKRLTGYEKRDTVDVETLTEILAFERLLFGIITQEMTLNTPYKAIYQKAKQQLLAIKRLWATPRLSA